MSVVYMTINALTNEGKGEAVYEYSANYTTTGTKDIVMLPNEAGKTTRVLVGLYVNSGTAKVQYSLSNRSDIIAGNGNFCDWDSGAVSSSTDEVLAPVNALRVVVATNGDIDFEVVQL